MLLLLSLFSAAFASADLSVHASSPVLVSVDGRPGVPIGPRPLKAAGLEDGQHSLTVSTLLGRTLWTGELELVADTETRLTWKRGELYVEAVRAIEPSGEPALLAPADETPVEEEGMALAVPMTELGAPALAEAVEAAEAEAEAVAAPVALAEAEAVAEAEAAAVAPVVPVAAQPAPAGQSGERTVTVVAQEGLRIDVVHAGGILTLEVEDGALVVRDVDGVEISFGARR